jgi:ribosomal protein S18 acetylase RimI-like enzyme
MDDPLTVPIRVRKAERSDAHTIADFNASMALETEGRELDAMRLFSGTLAVFGGGERGFYVVAERAGAVVGCLLVTREWSDWRNGWFWWIQSVYVVPSARRAGIYRSMYRWLETQAREDGPLCEGATIVGLRLYVERENVRAMATYEALGMRRANYQLYEVDFVLLPTEGAARVDPSSRTLKS